MCLCQLILPLQVLGRRWLHSFADGKPLDQSDGCPMLGFKRCSCRAVVSSCVGDHCGNSQETSRTFSKMVFIGSPSRYSRCCVGTGAVPAFHIINLRANPRFVTTCRRPLGAVFPCLAFLFVLHCSSIFFCIWLCFPAFRRFAN